MHDVGEYSFYTVLMKATVVPKGDDVFQEAGQVDLEPGVVDLHTGPVWLLSDRAVGFQQA